MKFFIKIAIIGSLIFCACSEDTTETPTPAPTTPTFFKGMDLSFQPELSTYGVTYSNAGQPISVLDFAKLKGSNLIRLKLWHTPQSGLNGLTQVKAYALQVKQRGLPFLLDIHYSDTWADPAHQTPPAAWQGLTQTQVENEVYLYTKQVLTELRAQDTPPQFVQIGNETDSGFLWDYGKVWDEFENNWANYAALIDKAIDAVRQVNGMETKIILHHSKVENATYFFEKLAAYNLDFDVIGLSYYPQFQTKDLDVVQARLNALASDFDKEIMIAEVAYPFTLGYDDDLGNFIGSADQIIPAYPATPQGQKDFLNKMTAILKNIPNHKGIGWIYWAPDWVAFDGNQTTSTGGSSWENQALWDFNHNALPAFDAFAP